MFPINDSSGRVIAFTGRILVDDKSGAKYLNSPDTVLFDKSSVLFGLDKAKHAIRQYDHTVLVEGQFGAIMAHQVGCTNTVALSGTALGDALETKRTSCYKPRIDSQTVSVISNLHLMLIRQDFVQPSDQQNSIISRYGCKKLHVFQKGMILQILLQKKVLQKWKEILTDSHHVILFYLDTILSRKKMNIKKFVMRDYILPFVASLSSTVEQSYFIKQISDKTGMSQSALFGRSQKSETRI